MAAATAPTLRPSLKRKAPGTRRERDLWEAGHRVVVGIDEVGRGAWAGPLTLGAVVIPQDRRLTKVRDSKVLTEREREIMFERITGWAVAWSVGHVWPEECDELGMSEAQRVAARRARCGGNVGGEPFARPGAERAILVGIPEIHAQSSSSACRRFASSALRWPNRRESNAVCFISRWASCHRT